MTNSPRWYVAVLVVRSKVADGSLEVPLVDLQYRLVRAADPEAAYSRALELGQAEGQSYRNAEGATVTWEFMGLHDLREVDDAELSDGVEVYSHLVRNDPSEYIVPKEKLSAIWAEANKHKVALELLDDQ